MSLMWEKLQLYRALKKVSPEDMWSEDAVLLEELEGNHELREIVREDRLDERKAK